jgi:hypothetical protein
MAERLAAVIPHSTLHIVDRAGHMVHYVAPEEVAHAVDAILSGNLPGNEEFAGSGTRRGEMRAELELAAEKQK